MFLAEWTLAAVGAYLGLGVAFALPFAAVGAGRLDPDARRGTLGFRVLIVPGATLLWPLLLARWVRGAPPPAERTPHKAALAAPREGEP